MFVLDVNIFINTSLGFESVPPTSWMEQILKCRNNKYSIALLIIRMYIPHQQQKHYIHARYFN